MNLWSLEPHQLHARPQRRKFLRQKPWREKIKDGSPPDFSGGRALECTQAYEYISAITEIFTTANYSDNEVNEVKFKTLAFLQILK